MASSSATLRESTDDRLSVLVVDDDESLIESLGGALRRRPFDITTASSCAAARRALEQQPFDVVLVDLVLPDGSGIELLDDRSRVVGTEFIVITGHGTIPTAVEAIKRGARNYLTKPVDPRALAAELLDLQRSQALERERHDAHEGHARRDRVEVMIGHSAAMKVVFEQVVHIAPNDESVLIEGESGTGKGMLARLIHETSPRAGGPFVTMSCGAIDDALVESELFGKEVGDPPHAAQPSPGLLEQARGGTLYLDEITKMSPSLQQRFLRALNAGSFRRVGGGDAIPIDVRLVSSISSRPADAVAAGSVRGDLMFRLATYPIRLPALRERPGDVALLASHFLKLLNASNETKKSWAPGALQDLETRTWAGNVREFRSAVERAYLLSGDALEAESAVADVPAAPAPIGERTLAAFGPGASVDEVERALILATMEHTKGHKPPAAKLLGISLKTLYNKLRAYGMFPS